MAAQDRSRNGLIAALMGVGVIGLVAVVLAALALGSGDSGTTATPVTTSHPSITVTGNGTATGVPNQLGFNLRVTLTRSDVATAMADASADMKKILGVLTKQGVAREDVQTTGLSIEPSYSYSNGNERLVGYTVTQRARVTVVDLRRAGRTLSAAAAAGGNDIRIDGIGLSISNRSALMAQARKAAVADAKAKAQAYAAGGGERLGKVLSLKEVSAAAPQAVDYLRSPVYDTAALKGLAPVPIKAGQKDMKVQIQVVWELG